MTDLQTIQALSEALEDEYKARAAYRMVIERFGPVRPFVNIAEAEDRHIEALLAQFRRLGEDPPQDTWPERVTAPGSLAEACADAIGAEIENDAMYTRLLGQVTDTGVREVMLRLQTASRTHHLPAFQRCLARKRRVQARGRGEPP
jgi:hypothetical protein